MFTPNLSILPGLQRQLWAELKGTPTAFVLYGGTALALRLGHRQIGGTLTSPRTSPSIPIHCATAFPI